MAQLLFDAFGEDDEFLCELGRLLLAACKFEVALHQYAIIHSKKAVPEKATLGRLLQTIRNSTYLAPTLDEGMTFAIQQRNYFVHNLSRRLSAYTTDDFDLQQFKNRLRGLSSDLAFFTRLVTRENV
jgi:hypothetical protein